MPQPDSNFDEADEMDSLDEPFFWRIIVKTGEPTVQNNEAVGQ